MSKLKLKSVQSTRSGGQTTETMHWGDLILYLDESGNWVDNSGNLVIPGECPPIDESGNVVDEGRLYIDAGSTEFTIGTRPGFLISVSWESGEVSLPHSEAPMVPVEFDSEALDDPNYIVNNYSVSSEWFSLTGARIFVNYTSYDGHHTIEHYEHGFFNLPYTFIPPKKKENE